MSNKNKFSGHVMFVNRGTGAETHREKDGTQVIATGRRFNEDGLKKFKELAASGERMTMHSMSDWSLPRYQKIGNEITVHPDYASAPYEEVVVLKP